MSFGMPSVLHPMALPLSYDLLLCPNLLRLIELGKHCTHVFKFARMRLSLLDVDRKLIELMRVSRVCEICIEFARV